MKSIIIFSRTKTLSDLAFIFFLTTAILIQVHGKGCKISGIVPTTTTTTPIVVPPIVEPPKPDTPIGNTGNTACIKDGAPSGSVYCRDVPEGRNASLACHMRCYAKNKDHHAGAICKPENLVENENSGETRLICRCSYNKCRNGEVDVVFLIDSSSSLSDNFFEEVEFVKDFASYMTIGQDASRVAAVQFASAAKLAFGFSERVQSQEQIERNLIGLKVRPGSGNITGAFIVAKQLLDSTKRQGIPQVTVLLVDGTNSNGFDEAIVSASSVRRDGVLIFAVGIGGQNRNGDLEKITGDIKRVYITDFSTLKHMFNIFLVEVIAAVNNNVN